MKRLDEMTLPELKNLQKRSATLNVLGVLIAVFDVLLVMTALSELANAGTAWHSKACLLLFTVLMLFVPVLYFRARTNAARSYFRINSALLNVIGTCGIISAVISPFIKPEGQANPVSLMTVLENLAAALIILIAGISLWKAAKSDALFGPGCFTRKQIKAAVKKRKREEPFTDEELPTSWTNEKLIAVSVIASFAAEGMVVVWIVITFVQALGGKIAP